ncbi:MAG: hypothetical protein ACRDT2_00795 [Natronosporangium sp.]
MLGRKTYTQEEIDHARAEIGQQLSAYQELATAVAGKSKVALAAFDPLFFNNLVLVLDRYFVHRLRVATGKDGNPLNEVEMLSDSLMHHHGVLRAIKVISYVPEQSVVGLRIGDPIRLTPESFERLATAFFTELERRFR